MSDKAMFNNKNGRYNYCRRNECMTGSMSGGDVPVGLVEYHATRILNLKNGHYNTRSVKTPEYGQRMTEEQVYELDRETGRIVASGRNTYRFLMSRAARKHGFTVEQLYKMGVCKQSPMCYLNKAKSYEQV